MNQSAPRSQPDVRTRPTAEPGQHQRAALTAAAEGCFVFPLRPGKEVPAIRRWQTAATRDPRLVERWWRDGRRSIGIATGPSRLLVLDLDIGHGDPPPPWTDARDGHDVLTRIAAAAGHTIPITRTVITPSGGQHLYFRAPAHLVLRNTAGQLGWCIDTRGVGGYVVAPGSSLPTGRYELVRAAPVAELPAWLLAALTPTRPAPADPSAAARTTPLNRAAYVRAIVTSECRAVTEARIGTRHHTLMHASRTLGRLVGGGSLSASEARAALSAAAHGYIGVEDYTACQVDTDIDDGLTFGAQLPRFLDSRP